MNLYRTRLPILMILLICIIISSSFYYPLGNGPEIRSIQPDFLNADSAWVDSVYRSLSRDERIAQLLMIRAYSNKGEDHTEAILQLVKKYNIGGLCFFQGGPVRQVRLTNIYQAAAKTPLLISLDAEWGPGMRLDSTISYPRQMMLGASPENALIYQMGLDVASQLSRIGVHMNFAPVVDINNNPRNPVINSRSFGENKINVAEKSVAYMRGMQDGGILCTAKHFPGHGDTDADSHLTLPVIPHSVNRLRSTELYPFQQCIDNGLSGIMTAHLFVPQLDSTPGRASSLSERIVTDLLKNEMGFTGLVVTDALEMSGVKDYNQPGYMEADALKAGNDILLLPTDVGKIIQTIKKEIRKNKLSWELIEAKCKKVLAAKYWAGLGQYAPAGTENLFRELNSNMYKTTQSGLVESSITLLKNRADLVPLKGLDTLRIASVAIGAEKPNTFQDYLSLYTRVDHFTIDRDAPAKEFADLFDSLADYNLVVAGLHNTDMRVSSNYGITENSVLFLEKLSNDMASVICIFANPYSLKRFDFGPAMQSLVMAYEDNEISQSSCAQIIFGGIPARGTLPVTCSETYREGDGIVTGKKIRLKYALPEDVDINSKTLYKVDSLALDAISKKAAPGCQILAALNGTVFYHKTFGYHTYRGKDTVKITDLYDIASLTKIISTLPSLMKLADEGLFSVDSTLAAYLPYLDPSNKGDLVIKDILAHRAGLAPWIPFYYSLLEPMNPGESLISRTQSGTYAYRLAGHIFINKNLSYADSSVSKKYSWAYPIKVAEDVYLHKRYQDTIFQMIINSKLRDNQDYLYSDLGYYFFHQIIEKITGVSLYTYTYHNFYKPLGTNYLGYLPLNRFSPRQIVPTENDLVFRRQLLQGYVEDPGAAMLGGIAGHSGIFSNANDLAKIMQMYLNKGEYGGIRYLSEASIDSFNHSYFYKQENRRGLGFDKPEMDYEKEGPTCHCVSPQSFGHTGFTGTMAWADPETGLLYIFLSNRVYPDQENPLLVKMNVRTNIQQAFHDAMVNGHHQQNIPAETEESYGIDQ